MDKTVQQRWIMAAIGAGAALALYGLVQMAETEALKGRALLAAVTLLAAFCGAVLVLNGPISLRRAVMGGAGLALVVTALTQMAGLRYTLIDGFLASGLPIFSILILLTLPLPFWIAHTRGNWREYDALFSEAWAILLRVWVAGLFVGVVWLLIYLSDLLLSIVGLTLIQTILDIETVPYLITGAALGLGLAVVYELSDLIGPHLILRLLRLLLPLVLAVVTVFLLALPLRGLSGLFGGISVGFTLIAITAAAATLITAVVDQRDEAASGSALLRRCARILAVLLPVMAALGSAAIFLRVRQYGWTPDRIFAAEVAALALGYGALYAAAALRGGDWMARIRQGNVGMALATIALAAATLTPILNAERMSANSQMARFADGRTATEQLDVQALRDWGIAGQTAITQLETQAKLPDQTALAARLADGGTGVSDADLPHTRTELAAVLPVQPASANAAPFIAQIDDYMLGDVLEACKTDMPTGSKGCAMVVADFLPDAAGDEAGILYKLHAGLNFLPLTALQGDTVMDWRLWGGPLPQDAAAEALIRSWQSAPPNLISARVNQIDLGAGAALVLLKAGQ